ncbi:MAG: hypothetical protein WA733_16735, partial [Methylocystis sp.]
VVVLRHRQSSQESNPDAVSNPRKSPRLPKIQQESKDFQTLSPRTLSLGSRCDLHGLFGLAQKVFGMLSHPSPDGVSFMVAFRFQDCCLFTRLGRGMLNVPPFENFSMYFNRLV